MAKLNDLNIPSIRKDSNRYWKSSDSPIMYFIASRQYLENLNQSNSITLTQYLLKFIKSIGFLFQKDKLGNNSENEHYLRDIKSTKKVKTNNNTIIFSLGSNETSTWSIDSRTQNSNETTIEINNNIYTLFFSLNQFLTSNSAGLAVAPCLDSFGNFYFFVRLNNSSNDFLWSSNLEITSFRVNNDPNGSGEGVQGGFKIPS